MRKVFNSVVAMFGTSIAYLTGDWDKIIQILALFMIIDYITGVSKAFIMNKADSTIGARGILKKGLIFVVVTMAHQMDKANNLSDPIFRTATIYFYLANEGISIFENLTIMGIPFPSFIKDRFEKVKDLGDKGENIDGE